MIDRIRRLFLHQWYRKLTALVAATVIWALVNHSITVTRTIPDVAIRILNVPEGKTIDGLLPNGHLGKRATLTLTGQKATLRKLLPTDLEVVMDAAGRGDEWSLEVGKRHLVTLNPDVDLLHGISAVTPLELKIALSPLVTEKVPVTLRRPVGEPPQGFTFLDIWPQRLWQTVSGPKEHVEQLKSQGIELTFDLSQVSRSELEALFEKSQLLPEDELRFLVPDSWKQVCLSFDHGRTISLNDPEATCLHLDFLKQELLPLGAPIPLTVFFPVNTKEERNPRRHTLQPGGAVRQSNGLNLLNVALYARNVSRLFLDTVRDHLQITLVPDDSGNALNWSIQLIDPASLEEAYVQASVAALSPEGQPALSANLQPQYLRERFRDYMRSFELYTQNELPLQITATFEGSWIAVNAN